LLGGVPGGVDQRLPDEFVQPGSAGLAGEVSLDLLRCRSGPGQPQRQQRHADGRPTQVTQVTRYRHVPDPARPRLLRRCTAHGHSMPAARWGLTTAGVWQTNGWLPLRLGQRLRAVLWELVRHFASRRVCAQHISCSPLTVQYALRATRCVGPVGVARRQVRSGRRPCGGGSRRLRRRGWCRQ